MTRLMRSSIRWFNLGLWLVAPVFAGFLTGLGGIVVDDLPQVEHRFRDADLVDPGQAAPLRAAIRQARTAQENADRTLDQASLKLQAAQQAYANDRETFGNRLATRKATSLPSQDEKLIGRTRALDPLEAAQNDAHHLVEEQQQAALDAQQAGSAAQGKLDELQIAQAERVRVEAQQAELRVFLYRLGVTLPLLGIAGQLFARKRGGTWWLFVWGFIIFALVAFFVEVVPYLPSYGGYVYYGVGLVVTALVGWYCIVALNWRSAQQALIERQPDDVRRGELAYDVALARLSKGVCPGCERSVDLKGADNSFCPHCGIGLFTDCGRCKTRKSTFSPFCHACGAPAVAAPA